MSIICDHCDRVAELEKENKKLQFELKKCEKVKQVFSFPIDTPFIGVLVDLWLQNLQEDIRMALMNEPRLL